MRCARFCCGAGRCPIVRGAPWLSALPPRFAAMLRILPRLGEVAIRILQHRVLIAMAKLLLHPDVSGGRMIFGFRCTLACILIDRIVRHDCTSRTHQEQITDRTLVGITSESTLSLELAPRNSYKWGGLQENKGMKKLLLAVILCVFCCGVAWATPKASVVRVSSHHRGRHHHAHRAGKHHTPKHRHHRTV